MKISCERAERANSGFSYMKKAEVSMGILTLIEMVIAVILIGWAVWFFGSLAGMWSEDEDASSIAAFDSLVVKINQLIQDPSPLAWMTLPYFLGGDNGLVGYRRAGSHWVSCTGVRNSYGYPVSGEWASVCAAPNCICLENLERLGDHQFVKCASTGQYDIYFSLYATPQNSPFQKNARGERTSSPDFLTLNTEYGSLRDLVLFGPSAALKAGCSDAALTTPLYLEKHEVPYVEGNEIKFEKIIYFAYGGDEQFRINEWIPQQVQGAVRKHIGLAEQVASLPEKIRLMQRLLKYPLNADQQLTVDRKLCDYTTIAKQWRLSADYCGTVLARMDREVEGYATVYTNYLHSLVETERIAQLTLEQVTAGESLFSSAQAENKGYLAYGLGSYYLLKAFDQSVDQARQIEAARKSRKYYNYYLESPDERYFLANRNIAELINRLEGLQKASEFIDMKVSEYRSVQETLRAGGGYPPELAEIYQSIEQSFEGTFQQKIGDIIARLETEINTLFVRKTELAVT